MPYFELGRGEPVILLHASASSSAQWRALAGQLAARYRVIAPDLHGYGATPDWSGEGEFRLAHEAQLVHAVLDHAGSPAHLVGHSFGGAVALQVARMAPHRLASLALIEPVAFHLLRTHDAPALAEIQAVAAAVAQSLASGDYVPGIAHFVDYWSGPGAYAAIAPEKRPGVAARLRKVAQDFEATLNEPANLADLRTMTLPTLVVQGTRSPRPTRRICELLVGVLPDATPAILAGAGHMSPLTHASAVGAILGAHLHRNSRRLAA